MGCASLKREASTTNQTKLSDDTLLTSHLLSLCALMATNPSPRLVLTLTLFLCLTSLASSLAPSPSPSPSPHPPPLKIIPSSGIPANHLPPRVRIIPDTLRNRHKLNFGQKLGILFAIVAGVMQFAVAGYLAIDRWQLGRNSRGFRERDHESSDHLV